MLHRPVSPRGCDGLEVRTRAPARPRLAPVAHVRVRRCAGAFVDGMDRTALEGRHLRPAERGWDGAFGEEALAGTKEERIDPEVEAVDEVVAQQRLHEIGAPPEPDPPVALLDLGDLLRDVAVEDGRARPVGVREGP